MAPTGVRLLAPGVALAAVPGCERLLQNSARDAPAETAISSYGREVRPVWPITAETLGPPPRLAVEERRFITVTATFAKESQLEAARIQLAELLELSAAWYGRPENAALRERELAPDWETPLTPPVRDFMTGHGLYPTEGGIGWTGPSGSAADAIQRVGQTLYVSGLRGYVHNNHRHPLFEILHWLGARRVVVEGDRGAHGNIVSDLRCDARSHAEGSALEQELRDYFGNRLSTWLRPPWHPDGVSPREAQARATYRRLLAGDASVRADPNAHQGVLAWRDRAPPDDSSSRVFSAHRREFLAMAGALELAGPEADGEYYTVRGESALSSSGAEVERQGQRVFVHSTYWRWFATGFPGFVQYLWDRGCRDMYYDLVDDREVNLAKRDWDRSKARRR